MEIELFSLNKVFANIFISINNGWYAEEVSAPCELNCIESFYNLQGLLHLSK